MLFDGFCFFIFVGLNREEIFFSHATQRSSAESFFFLLKKYSIYTLQLKFSHWALDERLKPKVLCLAN